MIAIGYENYKKLTLWNEEKCFVIVFDLGSPSKSGKKTPGLEKYWSAFAGQTKWGLGIGGLVLNHLDNHTTFHLEAIQTLVRDKEATRLTDWNMNVVDERKETLCFIFRYVVAYVWFSKKPTVDQITTMDMHLTDPCNYKTPQPITCITDNKGDECVDFIQLHKDRPFFLFDSFNVPHAPMQATEADLELFKHIKDEKRQLNLYNKEYQLVQPE